MWQMSAPHGQSLFFGELTLCGKRSRAPNRWGIGARQIGLCLLIVGLAGPAPARPEIGPTSSVSLKISLSVAPRYGLGAGKPQLKASTLAPGAVASSCLATNGGPITLPVMLVWSSETSVDMLGGEEVEVPLAPCKADDGLFEGRFDAPAQTRPLIVRPE